jgi:hypothetical protein
MSQGGNGSGFNRPQSGGWDRNASAAAWDAGAGQRWQDGQAVNHGYGAQWNPNTQANGLGRGSNPFQAPQSSMGGLGRGTTPFQSPQMQQRLAQNPQHLPYNPGMSASQFLGTLGAPGGDMFNATGRGAGGTANAAPGTGGIDPLPPPKNPPTFPTDPYGNQLGQGSSFNGLRNPSAYVGRNLDNSAAANMYAPRTGGVNTINEPTMRPHQLPGGLLGQPPAGTANTVGGGATNGTWDGFSSIDLTSPEGSMALDPAMMGQLGFNGLRASLTQLGGNNGFSEGARFWVQGANGENLGSLDQLGRTNGLDLRNLGPGAKINWSGLGAGGARLQGNGRRY